MEKANHSLSDSVGFFSTIAASRGDVLSLMPSLCTERRILSDTVVAAVASVYRAKRAYDSAKMKNTENVEEIGIFLAAARKTELEATKAFEDHVKEHGC